MKLKLATLMLATAAFAAWAQKTPINRGFLQSNLDGGGKSVTNLADVVLTGGTSLTNFLGTNAAGGVSVAAGDNVTAVTNGSLVTISATAGGQTNISYTAVTNAPWAETNAPTLFTPTLAGTTMADQIVATNFTGDGGGLTNLNVAAAIAASGATNFVAKTNGLGAQPTLLDPVYVEDVWRDRMTNIYSGTTTNVILNDVYHTTAAIPGSIMLWQVGSGPGDGSYGAEWINVAHGGGPPYTVQTMELQKGFVGDLALGWGYQSGRIRHSQVGIGPYHEMDKASSTFNNWIYHQSVQPFTTNGIPYPGYGVVMTFRAGVNQGGTYADVLAGVNFDKYPGFVATSTTNSNHADDGWQFHILRNLRVLGGSTGDIWSITNAFDDSMLFYNTTNSVKRGVNIRGAVSYEFTNLTASTTTYALDFERSAATSITLSGTNDFSFVTTNGYGGTSNYQSKVFLIRGGGLTSTLRFNSSWAGYSALPTNVIGTNMVRLQLETFGIGETNIVAQAVTFSDPTFAWDADADAFFTRATITDDFQKVAVNNLVLTLKAASVWTKLDAIYPFVGGAATPHSKNLKANTFNITWAGTVTHNANGVTGNGTDGYGDTGWIPSTDAAQDSISGGVYCRTQAPTDSKEFIGTTKSSPLSYFILVPSTSSINARANDAGNTTIPTSTDFRGFMGLTRTVSGTLWVQWRATQNSGGVTSVAPSSFSAHLLGRNDNGSPGHYSNANLAFAFLGDGLTTTELDAVRSAVDTFETALGRNLP